MTLEIIARRHIDAYAALIGITRTQLQYSRHPEASTARRALCRVLKRSGARKRDLIGWGIVRDMDRRKR